MQKLFIENRHKQKISVLVNEGGDKIVFIEHGLGGFKEQHHLQAFADEFYKNGFTTVLFDTTNSIGESDGEYEKATLGGSYEDLQDVIAWAKTQPWYKAPFALAGHSMGGYSVLQYAEDYPEDVYTVVAGAPVISGELNRSTHPAEELKEWQQSGWISRISNSKPGTELRLPWSHMEERMQHDLLLKADHLTMPILIIVGELDVPCPVEHQKMLFERIPAEKKRLAIMEKVAHSPKEPHHLEQFRAEIDTWLKNL